MDSKGKVERLRMKLGCKAKQEPTFRFYSLYGHIQRVDVLYIAWKRVRDNKGGPGIDGITISSLNTPEHSANLILEIQEELKKGTYRPKPVKRVFIEKSNGKLRPLGIPTVKDRIVQMATLLVLEPIFEQDFLDCSHGFRPARSAKGALVQIQESIKSGRDCIYDADLQGYFDTIPHDKLLKCLEVRISDRKVLGLIRLWLKCPIAERVGKTKKWKQRPPNEKGTPQGGVISPLLANIYLHWFDRAFHDPDGPHAWANARMVRYADDFVIMARYIDDRIINWVESKIEDWMDLTVNKEKSTIVNLKQGNTLDFLGYSFRWVKDRHGRNRRYLEMAPSKKSVQREKEALRELTNSRSCFVPVPDLILQLNMQMRGWKNYFKEGYPRKAFRTINYHVMERMRCHLSRRSQRRYRPPEGISYYQHVRNLGLIYL